MVEVFKTNIASNKKADHVLGILQNQFPGLELNFDLEDRDNILRVEAMDRKVIAKNIIKTVRAQGFKIEVLPDIVNTGQCQTKKSLGK